MIREDRDKRILEAVRCFMRGEKADWAAQETCDESAVAPKDAAGGGVWEEWRDFINLCVKHQVLPMVYEAIYGTEAFQSLPQDKRQMIRQKVFQDVMIQARKTEEFLALYKRLLEAGLTPMVVKGIICRQLYPQPDSRCSGDEDVLIPKDQFASCHACFLQEKMVPLEPNQDLEAAGEVPYGKKGGMLYLELHKELFPAESEAYGDFNSLFSHIWERKIQTQIGGVPIYTMGHTDHMLYLIIHAFKHFLHSGFGIRQVCDIVMYANAYGSQIQWEELLRQCRSVRAHVFAAALFDIGARHLTFDAEKACYPKSWQSIRADGEELLEDLISGGIYGDATMSRKHSSNITLQAVADGKKGRKGKVTVISSLFPSRDYMERTCPYLKEKPYLLPVAWLSRMKGYMRETRNMKDNDAAESVRIARKRLALMKKYKIIR